MLVVAVVFLIIVGVSTAVRLSEICNDHDYCLDNNYMIKTLCSAVSISLSELDSSPPLILVYLHQKGESQVL